MIYLGNETKHEFLDVHLVTREIQSNAVRQAWRWRAIPRNFCMTSVFDSNVHEIFNGVQCFSRAVHVCTGIRFQVKNIYKWPVKTLESQKKPKITHKTPNVRGLWSIAILLKTTTFQYRLWIVCMGDRSAIDLISMIERNRQRFKTKYVR